MARFATIFSLVLIFTGNLLNVSQGDEPLLGHWMLSKDAQDDSPQHLKSHPQQVEFLGDKGTKFNGRNSSIVVSDSPALHLDDREFTIALWAHTEEKLDDVLGNLLSKYDPASRTGFELGILNQAGVTSAQSNYRQLYFGIDSGGKQDAEWTDCGRPGDNLFVFALCVFQGDLYAGTFEHGADQAGHVYRYNGGQNWVDCGSPDPSNAVQALAVYDGDLYAGTGRYLSKGSALPESPNETPGGKVYRYDGEGRWIDCGKLQNPATGEAFTVGGMAVYQGSLYAGVSKHPGRGLYRYEGDQEWSFIGDPGHRLTNPVVYNGKMYFCSLDGGGITRYDGGDTFTDVGKPEGITQSYGFAIYQGQLYSSTWPNGEVFRYGGNTDWINCGRLGMEKEVMGMSVYAGSLFAGTLPLAEVYRYKGGTEWQRTGQLDLTPDVKYRRAWSMANFNGKLYCGVLPSGHVLSLEAGKNVTYDHALPAGWVHIAAVRDRDQLRLYVNGKQVASSSKFAAAEYDLTNSEPLVIGFGPHDYFNGRLKNVRLYGTALTAQEIAQLHKAEAP